MKQSSQFALVVVFVVVVVVVAGKVLFEWQKRLVGASFHVVFGCGCYSVGVAQLKEESKREKKRE